MENLAFCIKSNTVDTVQNSSCTNSSFWRSVYYSSSFGGGWEEAAILYQARGYEFPVIIPPLPNEDNYGYTVFKTNSSIISAKVQTFVPNPATQTAYLTYELPNDSNATLVITDINGKIQQQATLVGAGTYSLDTRYLSSGLYLYSVEQNGKILLRSKLAIIK